jgi:LCP family protein required for cell wall assembly
MMSIPRDTWVSIPGFDAAKINMAYFYGEAYHTPGGGPQLAMDTVSQFLGVPIQYYAVVDFNSFVKFIDKLDGIYVDVPEEIQVDPLGPGNTVTLDPGRQRLLGEVALAYARNRYTANGDFDRAKRQLQIILGVRDRVLDPKYLPILITHAGEVYDIVSSGVHTNLKLDEAIRLAWLAQEVKPENIHRGTLGRDQMIDSFSIQGWSIEIPIMDQVLAMRDSVFSTEQAPAAAGVAAKPEAPVTATAAVVTQPEAPQAPIPPVPVTANGLPEAVVTEGARIVLLNGTATSGLALRTSEYLRKLGFVVLEPSDAQGAYSKTTLVDYTGKSATVQYLAELMHIDSGNRLGAADPGLGADMAIVLGDDWANNNPMP